MYEAMGDISLILGMTVAGLGASTNIASLTVGVSNPSAQNFREWYIQFSPDYVSGISKPVLKAIGIMSYPGYVLGRKIYQKSTS